MTLMDALPEMKRKIAFYPIENESPQSLTEQQIAHYNQKGYICPLNVFSSEEAERNRLYFDDIMARSEALGYNSYSINGWHSKCEGIYDLVMNNRILDYVQDLVGDTMVCTMTHYFCKSPGDAKRVSWHQDASYWPLSPSKVVTVWLAIDDVDEDNGPMTVIPESHLHGQIPFELSKKEEANVLGQTVPAANRWGGPPVPLVMKAGQISMHSDLLLHGSEPNRSQRRRCGLTLRYMPPDVRGRDENSDRGVICRGHDPDGYWQQIPRPQGNDIR